MSCRAEALLSALNALEASIRSMASVLSASKIMFIAWSKASFPDFWPD